MTIDHGLLDRLRSRGEEVLTQVSAELMSNPRFVKAMEGALRGKEKLEEAARKAVEQMNVPTRTELKRALSRIETLEREVASLRAKAKAKPRTAARKPGRSPRRPRSRAACPGSRSPGPRPTSGGASCGGWSRSAGRTTCSPSTSRRPPRRCAGSGTAWWTSPCPAPTRGWWTCSRRSTWTRSSTRPSSPPRGATPRTRTSWSRSGRCTWRAAAAAAGVRHLVLRSYTAVYGARGHNPNFLTEETRADARVGPRLGARQGRGRGARLLVLAALPRPRGHRPALRHAPGTRRAHVLHAHLQQAGGSRGPRLRPARPAAPPRGRPARGGRRPSPGARAGSSTWSRAPRCRS